MNHMLRKTGLAALALVFVGAGLAHGQASFKVPCINDGIMLPDHKTFVVSIAAKATLIFFDTLADKELRRVELDFQPNFLAAQNDKLFVSIKGASIVHVLDAANGKELKEIKLGGDPVQALGCHPTKGLVYAVTASNDVFAIDPKKGTATKTKAKGQLIAVDPKEGKYVYTGIQKPIRDVLVIEDLPGGRMMLSFGSTNIRAVMLKYEVQGNDLKTLSVNDNAAVNGRSLAVSGDGKRIALSGGGGWWSKKDAKVRHTLAVFETSDLTSQLGALDAPGSPNLVAFHPVLNLGAIYMDNPGVTTFSDKSFVVKDTLKPKSGAVPTLVAFGAYGTKVVAAPMPGGPGSNLESVIEFFPLKLSDNDKAALKKAYGK